MNNTFDDIKNRAKSISDTDLTKKIQDSATNVLQVGLGALAKQQEDTTKIFDALVKQGQDIESKTKGVVKQQLRTAEDRVEEVKAAFDAQYIVPMHLPLAGVEQPWMKKYGGNQGVVDASYAQFSNTIRLTNEMECLTLD